MSDFSDNFAQALEAVNLTFAEAVTYTPAAGSASTDPIAIANAVVSPESSEDDPHSDGRRRRRVRFASFVTDAEHPNYSGVADPKDNATVSIGGVVYGVEGTAYEAHGVAVLKLIRRGQVEKTRPHYRGRG